MANLAEVANGTLADLQQLREEIQVIYDEQVLPNWGSPRRHGFPRTLYGYVMSTFALVDLISLLEHGVGVQQTPRMCRLLADRLRVDPHAAAVAVQMWRHTLMHTGNPGVLVDRQTGVRYQWLLHWAAEISREQHLQVLPGHDAESRILGTGLMYLIDDLTDAATAFFKEAAQAAALGSAVVSNSQHVAVQELTL